MNIVQKIKYRNFFENVVCSENCKEHIISLVEQDVFPKFKCFSDCILSIDELSSLRFPISLVYHNYTDKFIIIDSSKPAKIQKIRFSLLRPVACYISCFFESDDSSIEITYDLSTKKLSSIHFKTDGLEYSISCYDTNTSLTLNAIATEEDDKSMKSNYTTTITLHDVIFEKDHKSGFIEDFCDNFFAGNFSVTDLSFLSIIEIYSKNFLVEINRDGDTLKVSKLNEHFSLSATFKYNEKSHCSFESSADTVSTLKENFASFLKPFGI